MITAAQLQDYFSCHPLQTSFAACDPAGREAALRAARRDFLALLGREAEETAELEVAAVCEQALHIMMHPEFLSADTAAELTSESVEGIGKRSYRTHSLSPVERRLAPRARDFIAALTECAGTLRLER